MISMEAKNENDKHHDTPRDEERKVRNGLSNQGDLKEHSDEKIPTETDKNDLSKMELKNNNEGARSNDTTKPKNDNEEEIRNGESIHDEGKENEKEGEVKNMKQKEIVDFNNAETKDDEAIKLANKEEVDDESNEKESNEKEDDEEKIEKDSKTNEKEEYSQEKSSNDPKSEVKNEDEKDSEVSSEEDTNNIAIDKKKEEHSNKKIDEDEYEKEDYKEDSESLNEANEKKMEQIKESAEQEKSVGIKDLEEDNKPTTEEENQKDENINGVKIKTNEDEIMNENKRTSRSTKSRYRTPQPQSVKKENIEDSEEEEEQKAAIEEKIHYQSTTTPESERLLAKELGYPPSWHVQRISPHPSSTSTTTFMDFIFAGDPSKAVDTYYNHDAAVEAALDWNEGTSTGYEKEGGQMLPRVALFKKDENVEVLYEDGKWYKASIKKVKFYEDDIRYTVYYPSEDATQNNISEEDIRKAKGKKSTASTSTPKKTPVKRARKIKNHTPDQTPPPPPQTAPDPYETAKAIGLPEGWTAESRPSGKYLIRSPDKKQVFRSKKSAFDYLHRQQQAILKASMSQTAKRSNSTTSKNTKKPSVSKKTQEATKKRKAIDDEDGGDPPWRRTGHDYLGRFIQYSPPGSTSGETQIGEIMGWLDSIDVDSSGQPAYISHITNEPGILFHVVFADGDLLSCDFEEYEIAELLVDGMETERQAKSKGGKKRLDNMRKPSIPNRSDDEDDYNDGQDSQRNNDETSVEIIPKKSKKNNHKAKNRDMSSEENDSDDDDDNDEELLNKSIKRRRTIQSNDMDIDEDSSNSEKQHISISR